MRVRRFHSQSPFSKIMNNGATFEQVDILIVEDNPQDADLTIRALVKQHPDNSIYVVEDGVEALDFLFCRGKFSGRDLSSFPKMVLLDLKLPKLNGLEVLKSLKSNKSTSFVPVIVFTSSRETADIDLAYIHGANSYVVKPLNSDEFISTVNRLGAYWLLVNQDPETRAQSHTIPDIQ